MTILNRQFLKLDQQRVQVVVLLLLPLLSCPFFTFGVVGGAPCGEWLLVAGGGRLPTAAAILKF